MIFSDSPVCEARFTFGFLRCSSLKVTFWFACSFLNGTLWFAGYAVFSREVCARKVGAAVGPLTGPLNPPKSNFSVSFSRLRKLGINRSKYILKSARCCPGLEAIFRCMAWIRGNNLLILKVRSKVLIVCFETRFFEAKIQSGDRLF